MHSSILTASCLLFSYRCQGMVHHFHFIKPSISNIFGSLTKSAVLYGWYIKCCDHCKIRQCFYVCCCFKQVSKWCHFKIVISKWRMRVATQVQRFLNYLFCYLFFVLFLWLLFFDFYFRFQFQLSLPTSFLSFIFTLRFLLLLFLFFLLFLYPFKFLSSLVFLRCRYSFPFF